MNARRLAALYRDRARAARALADVDERIADALEGEEPANDAEPQKAPAAPKSKPKERRPPAPLHPVSDTDRIRARQMLRRRGMV